jgi:hypothetical protein
MSEMVLRNVQFCVPRYPSLLILRFSSSKARKRLYVNEWRERQLVFIHYISIFPHAVDYELGLYWYTDKYSRGVPSH